MDFKFTDEAPRVFNKRHSRYARLWELIDGDEFKSGKWLEITFSDSDKINCAIAMSYIRTVCYNKRIKIETRLSRETKQVYIRYLGDKEDKH